MSKEEEEHIASLANDIKKLEMMKAKFFDAKSYSLTIQIEGEEYRVENNGLVQMEALNILIEDLRQRIRLLMWVNKYGNNQ